MTKNFSPPFLPYFGEKIKSGGPYSFLISLLYFSAFQTREKYYLTSANQGYKTCFFEI